MTQTPNAGRNGPLPAGATDGASGVTGVTAGAPHAARATRAKVASAVPGRLRVRVHQAHRQHQVMAHVQAHLEDQDGIHRVETNAATGSVVVHYDPKAHSTGDVLDMLRDVGVIVAGLAGAEDELPGFDELVGDGEEAGAAANGATPSGHSRAALTVVDAVDDLNQRVSRATGGHVDLKLLFPAAMGAVGVWKVMADGLQLAEVPAYVLLWYAFDAFYKLHRQPPDQLATSATEAATVAAGQAGGAESGSTVGTRPDRASATSGG